MGERDDNAMRLFCAGALSNRAIHILSTSMHLIQLFLPLYDNDGDVIPHALFRQVRDELVERFGGLTAHSRAPLSGLWQEPEGETVRDDLVVYEVMVDAMDEAWWHDYRQTLEQQFRQESIVIRALPIRLL